MKILFSWVGHADLLGLAKAQPETGRMIRELIRKQDLTAASPVKITVSQKKFDKIVLLWTYDAPELMEAYRKYCGDEVMMIHSPLENPTDYRAVYCAAKAAVEANCRPPLGRRM